MDIHIGKIILQHLETNKISTSAFAKMLGVRATGLSRIFHKQHLHSALLLKISQQLNHNFFQYYVTSPQHEKTLLEQEKNNNNELQKQILQQQNELEKLKTENNFLREMVDILKQKNK